jgi:hypothetical protein
MCGAKNVPSWNCEHCIEKGLYNYMNRVPLKMICLLKEEPSMFHAGFDMFQG